MSVPSAFGTDTLVDSDDLMSWLLLNPDGLGEFDHTHSGDAHLQSAYPDLKYEDMLASHDADYMREAASSSSDMIPSDSHGLASGSFDSRDAKEAKTSKRPVGGKSAKKRPRESVEDLEARVIALKSENADLHAHLLNVTQRTTEVQKQRIAMEKLMAMKLAELGDKEDSDQSELAQLVKQYTDIYADYGKCRQREVAFHLQQIEKLMVPTNTTKMCLWTLQQDKSFYQSKKSSIYDILSKTLEISAEQTSKILERREKITGLLHQLRECLELLKSLKVAVEKKHASYDAVCGRVQAAATPKQIVKFQMWITKNADLLGKYIPGFSRSSSHIPNAQFVEPAPAAVGGAGASAGTGRGVKRSASGQAVVQI